MPLFSVIIPLYNKENYIQQTIESVLQQTVTDFELLVVNDASTDNSVSVVSKISDSRIKLVENAKNVGLSATRNHGISKASGKIIALLDADDLWLPNFLETIQYLHKTFPEASIYGTDYAEMYESQEDLVPKKNISAPLQGTSFVLPDFFVPMACLHRLSDLLRVAYGLFQLLQNHYKTNDKSTISSSQNPW